jgi:hypothetical protein
MCAVPPHATTFDYLLPTVQWRMVRDTLQLCLPLLRFVLLLLLLL